VSLHYAEVPAQPWPALEARWLPALPPVKRDTVSRLRAATDRNASLLVIALLASALAARGRRFEAARLEFPERGKPRLPDGPDFSISHASGLVACALVEGGRVGLDLEPAGAVAAATVGRVLDASERGRLERGELAATDAWVQKEAVAKLFGCGVAALRRISLDGSQASFAGQRAWLVAAPLPASHTGWLALDADARAYELDPVGWPPGQFAPLPLPA
jgi:phosphopantetheinyl transferase